MSDAAARDTSFGVAIYRFLGWVEVSAGGQQKGKAAKREVTLRELKRGGRVIRKKACSDEMSVRAFAADHGGKRAQQDKHIVPQAPIRYVSRIHGHAFAVVQTAPARDLP